MISSAMTARLKPLQPGKASLITVLDIGSVKVCCAVARLVPRSGARALKDRTHNVEVLGFAYGPSAGVKGGVVTDLEQAEKAVRAVVGVAERHAGVTVQSVIVNVSSGRLDSENFSARVALDRQEVDEWDLERVLGAVNERCIRDERSVLHALPIGYTLDGYGGIQDPLGMVGEELGVDIAVVTAETLPMRNLELVLNKCHLQVQAFVATPYASGLAALVDDEAALGVAAIDFGGTTTTVSIFKDNRLVYADALAIGSHNITLDIARQLSVCIEDAERLKTLYTSVIPGQGDERDSVTIHPVGAEPDEAPTQVPRAVFTRIVRPRIEEILNVVHDRMVATGMMDVCGRRIVLVGGGSELTGLPEMARRILARNVRQGRPLGVAGLPAIAKGPAFSTLVGMLVYPQMCDLEYVAPENRHKLTGTNNYLARIGGWLRNNF